MRVKNGRLEGATGNLVPFKAKKFPVGNPKLSGSKPRFLVIHYTAGGSASGAISTFQSAKASAHLVIGHNGDVTQMAKFDEVCWHAGESRWKNIKGLNSHSIGIEIVNWGKLRKTASGDFVTWTGSKVSADRVIEEEHKHFPGTKWGWEIFDPAQMEATLQAARAIVEEYDISPWDLVGHDDISPLRKVDPGPAFDMDSFRASVFGRPEDDWDDLIFKVNSNTGLNMRTEASVGGKLIKNLPDNTKVHVIEKTGKWWLVAEVISNDDDVTGYVHSHWLQPSN